MVCAWQSRIQLWLLDAHVRAIFLRSCAHGPDFNFLTSQASVLTQVRSHCEPVLQRFNFHWPTLLDCDALPVRSDRIDLCIEPPGQDDRFPSDGDDVTIEQLPPEASDDDVHNDDGVGGGGLIRLVNVVGSRPIPTLPADEAEWDFRGPCPDRYASNRSNRI